MFRAWESDPMQSNLPRPISRIEVEASVQDSILVEKVPPASVDRAPGVVRLTVIVGKDGTVLDATAQDGPSVLVDSARKAIMQWRYRPMLLNGFPVEVQTVVEVSVAP
jgi:outer membrane biosynthesis protein TonB